MQHRAFRRRLPYLLGLFFVRTLAVVVPFSSVALAGYPKPGTYTNPLNVKGPSNSRVESCADPSIIQGQQPGDNAWYMYCTKDPLNNEDRNAFGEYNFNIVPMLRSLDLVNWTYVGNVFNQGNFPDWVAGNAGVFAPDIEFFQGKYYLYYSATHTNLPGGGSAIGVATSTRPTGPWIDSGRPVVEPQPALCCLGSYRATIDPEVVEITAQKYIYYGSYLGGISVRKLSADGLTSDPSSQTQITIDNRYEAPHLIHYDGYYYLFVSATDCCRGPLTGYSVFVGRSTSPRGPFIDREGVSLLSEQVGGTPVLSMNGNRWVGPGHNAVFQDFQKQYWTVYHAVDRIDPYFTEAPGFNGRGNSRLTKRPLLIDPLDWIDGWPTVRGALWASDTPQPLPAAQTGNKSKYTLVRVKEQKTGKLLPAYSDEFNAGALSPQWRWVRQPIAITYRLKNDTFRFDTQEAELNQDRNTASVLTEPAPEGEYLVEAKVRLNVPPKGCTPNCRFVQAGLVIYRDDDNYSKLALVTIFNTRQTEFAKEASPVLGDYPRYGNTVVGPSGNWTYLRLLKRVQGGEEQYTAYTSRDGQTYVRGGTWTHTLGFNARIGLVSMGGPNFTASFDYLRVYRLHP